MGKRYDWDHWRSAFVRGGDEITLAMLAQVEGAPAYQTLQNRSSAEDWAAQRNHYREMLSREAVEHPEPNEVSTYVKKVVDAAEVITRHSKFAKSALAVASSQLKTLHESKRQLKPTEIIALAKLGMDAERLILGMATERKDINVSELSDEELKRYVDS